MNKVYVFMPLISCISITILIIALFVDDLSGYQKPYVEGETRCSWFEVCYPNTCIPYSRGITMNSVYIAGVIWFTGVIFSIVVQFISLLVWLYTEKRGSIIIISWLISIQFCMIANVNWLLENFTPNREERFSCYDITQYAYYGPSSILVWVSIGILTFTFIYKFFCLDP